MSVAGSETSINGKCYLKEMCHESKLGSLLLLPLLKLLAVSVVQVITAASAEYLSFSSQQQSISTDTSPKLQHQAQPMILLKDGKI